MTLTKEIQTRLRDATAKANQWTEFRYHLRKSRGVGVRKGVVSDMSSKHVEGLGVRVLYQGTWGFAATTDLTTGGIEKCLRTAEQMAMALASRKKHKVVLPASSRLAKGDFFLKGVDELIAMPTEEKFEFVRDSEERLRKSSKQIEGAACQYSEVFEEKLILTTDGADSHLKLVRPELRFLAYGADGTKRSMGYDSVGGTGGWDCLF